MVKKEVVSKELLEIQALNKKIELLEKRLDDGKKVAPITSCPAPEQVLSPAPVLPVKTSGDPLKDFLSE